MKNHIDSNFAIAILALVAACVGFAFWFLTVSDDLAETNSSRVTVLKGGEVFEEEMAMEKIVTKKDVSDVEIDSNTTEYVSENLGIKFAYANHPGETFDIDFVEKGTVIQMRKEYSPSGPNDIEVFTFDPTLTHKEGIKTLFLDNTEHDKECFVEDVQLNDSYSNEYGQALISHPLAKDSESLADPWFVVAHEHCPAKYSHGNYYKLFLYNKNVPGKVVFVVGGQDSVASDGNGNDWTHSVEIIK